MKKPNITEGKWKVEKYMCDELHCINITGPKEAILFNQTYWEPKDGDLQAISAVPEMIDALIKVKQATVQYIERADDDLLMEVDGQIEQALKKAGVEL